MLYNEVENQNCINGEDELPVNNLDNIRITDDSEKENKVSCPHFDFIDVYQDECLILGASNLNGRYWVGELFYYTNIEDVTTPVQYNTKLRYETGICDGHFLGCKNKIIIGDDYGSVSIYNIVNVEEYGELGFLPQCNNYEHDNAVVTISVSSNNNCAVSGSMDCGIKVWQVDPLCSEHTYYMAHSHHVTCVCFMPDSNEVFSSTSLDGFTLLWDVRKAVPAQVIASNCVGYTAMTWFQNNTNKMILGNNDGTVAIVDIRRPCESLYISDWFDRSVHKLCMHPESIYVAACADKNELKIFDCKENLPTELYFNNNHTDFVRSLVWCNTKMNQPYLLSCGWDSKVLRHSPF